MASLASKTFKAQVNENAEYLPRAARRVILNSDVLKASKACTGDIVVLSVHGHETSVASQREFAVGILWPSLDLPLDAVAVSTSLLLTAGITPGKRVRLVPLSGSASPPPGLPSLPQAKEAKTVRLEEIPINQEHSSSLLKLKGRDRDWVEHTVREYLVDLKYIVNNQIVHLNHGVKRQFRVRDVDVDGATTPGSGSSQDALSSDLSALSISRQPPPPLWVVTWDTQISLIAVKEDAKGQDNTQIEITSTVGHSTTSAYSSVGGLDKQIQIIRDLLEIPLTRPDLFRHFALKPPKGILLHGPPGTGKTHLARAIASSTNSSVLVVNGPELSSAYHGETEAKLRDVFKQARQQSPCIVVLDEVDALVPRREDAGGGGGGGQVEQRVVATLLTILDGMDVETETDNARVVVIGTTNRPNAIDPALRRPGRFDKEIEIGVPDAQARYSILQVLLRDVPHDISSDNLLAFASKLHGYVGADISAIVREAGTIAIKRHLHDPASSPATLGLSDLVSAMPSIRPSAMRSVFVEAPQVRFSDVGGQASVIQKLREAVEWPLLHPEAFQRLGVRPPKGILLYGPPGCSKTVLARACACETGVNFVAVKGPELLNKFVGESERAVREIFRKARAASPAIIFFDEIDALATSRSSSDSDFSGSHEGVLTSLLNEMDGVQELTGVTVVAATNRPDALDSALMRPGRLDRILYVGPPDHAGREDILRIKTRTMAISDDVDIKAIADLTDGCSGAEITALCQEAAILTMQEDMNAPSVTHKAFVQAAKAMKRQITPAVLASFSRWRDASNLQHA